MVYLFRVQFHLFCFPSDGSLHHSVIYLFLHHMMSAVTQYPKNSDMLKTLLLAFIIFIPYVREHHMSAFSNW